MNKKLSYFLIAIVLILTIVIPASAQFGIGTSNPDPSAALDIVSTDQGVLHPRLTTVQRDAISSPAEGLTIYNTTDSCLQVYDGTAWNCAVGGSGGGTTNGDSSITLTTGSGGISIEEVPPVFNSGQSVDIAWLDNDRFIVVESYSTSATFPYFPIGKGVFATIYDVNFHQLTRFSVPVPDDAATTTIGFWPVVVAKLQNGNLMFATVRANPTTYVSQFFGVVITQEDGTVVTPWIDVAAAQVGLMSGFTPIQDLVVLDNGNVVLSAIYVANNHKPTSIVMQEDGTFIRETRFYNAEPLLHSDSHGVAATTFGFATICACYPNSATPPPPYTPYFELYDFDGNVLAQPTFETDPASPFGPAQAQYYSTMALARVQGDTLYASIKRMRDGQYAPGPDDFDPYQTTVDHMMGGFRKFTVNSSGVLTVVKDIETTREPGTIRTRFGNFLTTFSDGRLLAFGSKVPDLLSNGESAGSKYDNGASLPIMHFDANGDFTDITNVALKPFNYRSGYGALGIPWLDQFAGVADVYQHLLLSPDGQKLFLAMHNNIYGYHYVTFDLSTGELVPYTRTLLDNGQDQNLPKSVSFYSVYENLNTVEIAITNGAGTNDTLNCIACTPTTVAGSYNAATKVLTLTDVSASGSMVDGGFAAAFQYLTFMPDGTGIRTFEITATDTNGNSVSKTMEFEVVAP